MIQRLFLIMPAVLLAFLGALFLTGCGQSDAQTEPLKLQGKTMGTVWHAVIVVSEDEPPLPEPKQLQAGLEQVLKTVNDQMSTWQSDSELSRFNQYQQTDWFPVSAALADVANNALQVSQVSQGIYDVTVGPLVNLWGFGANKKSAVQSVPTPSAIEATLLNVGYGKLVVRVEPPALRKLTAGLYVDLSSIAKGYGVDQMAAHLDQLGLRNYMVEIGGEIHVKGQSPRGDDWRIAVEKPAGLERSVQQGLVLKAGGLATSGDYRNFFAQAGRRYSHTLNPLTGYAVKHNLASVSVMADNTMLADAYATMLMAMGEAKGKAFALEQGIDSYFIWRTDEGFESFATDGFQQAFIQQ